MQADQKGKETPKAVEPPPPKDVPPAAEPTLIARTEAGGEAPTRHFTRMMGDWIGAVYADEIVTLPGTQFTTRTLTTTRRTTQTVLLNGELVQVPVIVTVPMVGYVSADKNGDRDVNKTPDYLNKRFVKSRPRKGAPFTYPPDTNNSVVYQDEFVACLKLLVRDSRLRQALGRNGRDYVAKHYRWDVVLAQYERLFAKVKGR